MELRTLRYFLAVAQAKTISAAAEALHVTQPTLSRQMQELEEELGKTLFLRGKRSITLTEEGTFFRKRAQEILSLLEKTTAELRAPDELLSGDIHIGGGETDAIRLIARAARRMRQDHPHVTFHIFSGNAEDVMEKIDRDLVDFGLFIEPVDLSGYEFFRLPVKDRWGVLMRKDAPLAARPSVAPADLRGLPLPEWTAFVPAGAAALYAKAATEGLLLDSAKFEVAVLTQLRMQPPENFAQLRGISEGLENRLAASVRQADGLDDLYTRLKTKRYPHARLRRLVLDAALQFPAELPMPPYLHVLGAKKRALPRLKYAALPSGTALAELVQTSPQAAEIGRLHSRAVDFSSLCREKIQPMGLAFTAKPVVI
mgnify:CR=1 FL=1